jgi:signal transduction histidine kinase
LLGNWRAGKISVMSRASKTIRLAQALILGLMVLVVAHRLSLAQAPNSPVITNLAQLTAALDQDNHVYASVALEGIVCASSQPSLGVLVLQDDTGVELLQLGGRPEAFAPGEKIRIEGDRLLLRRRELGTQISAAPVVDNDGLHPGRRVSGNVALKAGRVPVLVEWFNRRSDLSLYLGMELPGQMGELTLSPLRPGMPAREDGSSRLVELQAEVFEGAWDELPNFDLLRPVKTTATTNFNFDLRTRNELVGLRFNGFLEAPRDGVYTFHLSSDDGSMLFLSSAKAPIQRLESDRAPLPATGWIGQRMDRAGQRRWLTVEGRVSVAYRRGHTLELELRSGADSLSVGIADAGDLDPATVLNRNVRLVGVGRAAISASQSIVLSRLCVASLRDFAFVELGPGLADTLPVSPISRVQSMSPEEAGRAVPVRVHGVITAVMRPERFFSLQEDTRGVFVDYRSVTNLIPRSGEFWEVTGYTAPGNFAPIVVAQRLERRGRAKLPEPARPSWRELANGSMDQQWVEFQGVVSEVRSNQITLLMPEGALQVALEHYFDTDLNPYQHAVVRVRGTLFAGWNAATREVQFGNILLRNVRLSVDVPPPADPFAAPLKSARDLLRFDVPASAYSPVKVQAQALYTDGHNVFAMDQGAGIRIQTAARTTLSPGDWFEAVGYPEISGPSPLLRYALIRKTGTTPLPDPQRLAGLDASHLGLDSTLVTVEGNLTGTHVQQGSVVLEVQSHGKLFLARIKPGAPGVALRLGSRLQLAGVYLQTGDPQRSPDQAESFELLLNSPADIRVLSQPSRWTLKHMAIVVGVLLVGLLLATLWISQLRRQVEQRTNQLRQEIRQREHAERQHAIEAERSRIARDLHDDLGSGLSEINLLVSAHQKRAEQVTSESPLFRTIATRTRRLISALDVIVWAVNPEDNSLQSLADYLNGFVAEYLSSSGVTCRLKVPVLLPPVTLDGQVRHDLLMAVKEALNNIVRHANATEVEFRLTADQALHITITDNGKGFDVAAGSGRHGLKNLSARLSALGGSCQVSPLPEQGTTVAMFLPLSSPMPEKGPTANAVGL